MPQAQPQIKTGAWDQDEDDLLYYWQGKVGNKWSEVAKHIPGRTGQQCAQRWRHKVNPNIRRDKWTSDEDAKLIELVKTFGVGRWAEIARNCDGRTDQQCMGRWRRHLDPSIRRDSWSPEEDAKLRQLHAQYGTSWSRISKCLKGRTSQQCRARWHQINNGRGKPAPTSNGGGSDTAAGGRHQGAAAGGRRGGAGSRRRASRRCADSSASEDDEEDEPEEELDEDDLADDEQDYESHKAAAANASHQHLQHTPDQNSYYDPHDRAYAAAMAVGGYVVDPLLKCEPQHHQEQQQQQQRWAPTAATHHHRNDLAYPSDQEEANDDEFDDDCADEDEDEDDVGDGYQATVKAAAAANPPDDDRLMATAVPPLSCDSPHKLTSSSQQHQAAGAVIAASHCKAQRAGVRSPSPSTAWQQQLAGDAFWSPSRLLLSPPQGPGKSWQGRASSRSACKESAEELNDEETAGAETLLQMAHLLRRESCELQPPSLRRSDFITASTPPKRPAAQQDLQLVGDPLSPSPCKRARSSRSAALFRHSPGCLDEGQARQSPASMHHQVRPRSRASATAAAAAWGSRSRGKVWTADEEEDEEEGLTDQDGQEQGNLQAKLDAAAAADEDVDDDACVDVCGSAGRAEHSAEDAVEEAGSAPALDARHSPGMAGDMLGFGISTARTSHGSRGLFAGSIHSLPEPPARPSNASSLTGLHGGVEAAAAAAADSTAAVFMSPPPVMRTGGRSSRQMVTPRRPAPQQNLANMLCSPSFDRVTGGVTPPSAGHTQPSAATLAALQSPLPSRVHEPFWTPFTCLFKDALFSRGTSATPDLPSGGKTRTGNLFSPAGKRSSSGSKGSAGNRQQSLAGVSPDTVEDILKTEDGAPGAFSKQDHLAASVDMEPGPSPAYRLQQSVAAVHHRVVRRLDQHEAWGACPAGAKGAGGVGGKAGSSDCDGPRCTGFSLFSPVKKQRVPLFDESSTINVGVSPARPHEPEEDPLAIAPLMHHLPANGIASSIQAEQVPGSQHGVSGTASAGVAVACTGTHGPKPSNCSSREPTVSWKRPPASRLLSTHNQQQQARQWQQQGDHHHHHHQQQEQEQEEQHLQDRLWPQSSLPLNAAQLEQEAGQQGLEQQEQEQLSAQQQQQQISSEPTRQEQAADSNTPVHVEPMSGDTTSCSGTPSTPAGQPQGLASLMKGAAAGASPDEYITPQQRVRPVRPMAPLHKDCLIAAATRCLASTMAAAAAGAPAADGQQSCGQATPESKAGHDAGAAAAPSRDTAVEQPVAPASAVGAAVEALVSADAVPAYQEQPSSSALCSGDSSKLSPMAQVMDSPLQPCQQLQSPSQWHQGMVAMLRNLQQTPLQPTAASTGHCTLLCKLDQAGESVMGCEGSIKPGSRALRRLQDELERGSSMAAQQQARHTASARAGSARYGSVNAAEVQMPFSSSSSSALALAPAAAVLVVQGSTAAPTALPSLLNPAANTSQAGPVVPAAGGQASRSTALAATPPGRAQPTSGVASVSWTPAVVSRAEGAQLVTMVQTPPACRPMSAAVTSTTAMAGPAALGTSALQLTGSTAPAVGAPAVAWPVQQRPDGGFVVAASSAAPSSSSVLSLPASSQVQLGAPIAAAAGFASGSGSWGASSQPLGGGEAAVVLAGVKGVATLPSLFALSAKGSSALDKKVSAVPASLGGADGSSSSGHAALAGGVSLDLRCDSSHVVRSRLHALIDGV